MTKIPRPFLALLVALGLTAWGCGGGGGFHADTHTSPDGEDVEATGDVAPDGEDVPPDVPPDEVTDTAEDTPTDGPTDVETDDGGPTRTYRPFTAETCGGAKVSSTNYELELFVAPVRPVGSVESTNYNFKLGPGGIRSQ